MTDMSAIKLVGLLTGSVGLMWIYRKLLSRHGIATDPAFTTVENGANLHTHPLRENDLETDACPELFPSLEVPRESLLDGVVLHVEDEEDRSKAKKFCDFVSMDSDYTVGLYDELGMGETLLRIPGEVVFSRAIYLFVLVTPLLNQDNLTRMLTELGIIKCLEVNQYRVIPILTNRHADKNKPSELKALKGVRCFWLDSVIPGEDDHEKQRTKSCLNRLFQEGRRKFCGSQQLLDD